MRKQSTPAWRKERARRREELAYGRAVAARRATVERLFARAEGDFKNGITPALWNVVIFCEQADWPKPEWARRALVSFAHDYVPTLARDRAAGADAKFVTVQAKRMEDMRYMELVDGFIKELHCTPTEAYRRTAAYLGAELPKEKVLQHDALQKISRAVARARARVAAGTPSWFSSLLPIPFEFPVPSPVKKGQ